MLSEAPPPKTVQFHHPFFQTNAGGYFHLDQADRRPVYVINLGDQAGIVSIQSIRQELLLGDHGDDQAMLEAVSEALKFVDEIHMGDSLPNEIVNGEASWEPETRHRKIADQRVVAAMVKWSEKWDGPITDVEDLRQFTAQYVDQEKIARALRRLDETVGEEGHGLTRIQPVLKRLAKELSYIEAQRETLERIRRIGRILEHVRRVGGGQSSDTHEVTSVLRLFKLMMRSLDDRLASVDEQVREFLAAVSAHETLFEHIRSVRDDLRHQLMAWDETLSQWDSVTRKDIESTDITPKIGDLYRFLAPRYAPTDDWVRIDQFKESAGSDGGADSGESAQPAPHDGAGQPVLAGG
jgi:hypothetical protein